MGKAQRDKDGTGVRRRTVIAASAAAVVVAGVASHQWLTRDANAAAPELGPVSAGTRIERWTVVAVHPIKMGGIPVVLETGGGQRYQVDILARDDATRGVATTKHFGLYIANQGDGNSPTDEDQGLGAQALGRALADWETRATKLPELLTLSERNAAHPGASFGVKLR